MRTPITVDTARMLAHAALLAAWEGQTEASDKIFAALERAKPKEPNVRLCRALVWAFQDRFAEASELLQQVLVEQPDNATARGLLGFVLYSAQEPGWQAHLEAVADDPTDPATAQVARSILERRREAPVASASRGKGVVRRA